ncbi:hypothetical protein ASE86_10265 [Sphingomonas sp. Leaf33]|nr:hypothetical protein ASE86_10265 [Sphingomonas sp. Leaf33]
MARPVHAIRLCRSIAAIRDVRTVSPTVQVKDVPAASGPASRLSLTSGCQDDQRSMSLRIAQTVRAGADITIDPSAAMGAASATL